MSEQIKKIEGDILISQDTVFDRSIQCTGRATEV